MWCIIHRRPKVQTRRSSPSALSTTATRSFPRSSTDRTRGRGPRRARRRRAARSRGPAGRRSRCVSARVFFKRRAAKLQLRQTPGDPAFRRRRSARSDPGTWTSRRPRLENSCARPCATPPRLAARRWRPSRQHPAQGGTDDHPDHPSRSSRGGVRRPSIWKAAAFAAARRRRRPSAGGSGVSAAVCGEHARAHVRRAEIQVTLCHATATRAGTFAANALGSCASTSNAAGWGDPGARPGRADLKHAVLKEVACRACPAASAAGRGLPDPPARAVAGKRGAPHRAGERLLHEQGRRNAGRADGDLVAAAFTAPPAPTPRRPRHGRGCEPARAARPLIRRVLRVDGVPRTTTCRSRTTPAPRRRSRTGESRPTRRRGPPRRPTRRDHSFDLKDDGLTSTLHRVRRPPASAATRRPAASERHAASARRRRRGSPRAARRRRRLVRFLFRRRCRFRVPRGAPSPRGTRGTEPPPGPRLVRGTWTAIRARRLRPPRSASNTRVARPSGSASSATARVVVCSRAAWRADESARRLDGTSCGAASSVAAPRKKRTPQRPPERTLVGEPPDATKPHARADFPAAHRQRQKRPSALPGFRGEEGGKQTTDVFCASSFCAFSFLTLFPLFSFLFSRAQPDGGRFQRLLAADDLPRHRRLHSLLRCLSGAMEIVHEHAQRHPDAQELDVQPAPGAEPRATGRCAPTCARVSGRSPRPAPHHSRRDTPPPGLSAHAPPSPLSSAGSNPERASSGVADAPGSPSGSSADLGLQRTRVAAAPSACAVGEGQAATASACRGACLAPGAPRLCPAAPGATPPGLRAAAEPSSTSFDLRRRRLRWPRMSAVPRRGRSAGVRDDASGSHFESVPRREAAPGRLISRGHVRRVAMTPSSHSAPAPLAPGARAMCARPLETLAPKTTLPSREKEPSLSEESCLEACRLGGAPKRARVTEWCAPGGGREPPVFENHDRLDDRGPSR